VPGSMKTTFRPSQPRPPSPGAASPRALLPPRRTYDRETLVALLDALEAERVDLDEGFPEAIASILRIAQALHHAARTLNLDAVTTAVNALEKAATDSPEAFTARLDDLLDALRRSIAEANGPKTRILVIDPDPDTAAMLEVILSTPNREVLSVGSAREAERLPAREAFALIILELVLPDMDGRNLLVRLRAHAATALTPVIVVSSFAQPQVKTECYALGADAFFEKPFDPAAFSAQVSAHLRRRVLRDTTDPLTGLPDRLALEEAFERARAFYDLSETPFCIAVLDFDDFKAVNAVYGPLTGDDVLQEATTLITQCLRAFDLFGRWEGDRFCILFPNTTLEDAAGILDRASQAVRYEPFRAHNGQTFHVSFSAGLVTLKPEDTRLEDVVERARQCVRRAKANGARGRVITEAQAVEPEKPRVLVAENDEDVAAILAFRLRRDGFEVVRFADGKQLVAFAERHRAALVILDAKLPGLDGFEALTRLRAMPAHARTPVLMLTSMGRERDIARGFELGADDYLLKPFSPVELSARVRRLVERHAPAALSP